MTETICRHAAFGAAIFSAACAARADWASMGHVAFDTPAVSASLSRHRPAPRQRPPAGRRPARRLLPDRTAPLSSKGSRTRPFRPPVAGRARTEGRVRCRLPPQLLVSPRPGRPAAKMRCRGPVRRGRALETESGALKTRCARDPVGELGCRPGAAARAHSYVTGKLKEACRHEMGPRDARPRDTHQHSQLVQRTGGVWPLAPVHTVHQPALAHRHRYPCCRAAAAPHARTPLRMTGATLDNRGVTTGCLEFGRAKGRVGRSRAGSSLGLRAASVLGDY